MPPATEDATRSRWPVAARRISPAEKLALVPEVLRSYRRARREIGRSDLPTTLSKLRGATGKTAYSEADHLVCNQMAGAVMKTLWLIPTRSRCLMQSLTLTEMLARRDIGSSLVIGVRSGDIPDPGDFVAHAWVEYHGNPVLPVQSRRYERLTEV
jgi:hypothetical protein